MKETEVLSFWIMTGFYQDGLIIMQSTTVPRVSHEMPCLQVLG